VPRIPAPAWSCGHNGAVRATTSRPPGWLVACKVLLAGLLLTGALFPDVGGFAGKGMAFRLPIFLAPALVVPIIWWRRRGPYPAALDAALTLPFLLDTAANAVGLYDHLDATDDILHFVNWFVLVGGITATWVARADGSTPRWLLAMAGAGFGAIAIIFWEVAEYSVMRSGVGGLDLTYADTLGDLVLSTVGGALGALAAVRFTSAPSGKVRVAGAV
jgi:hypothetical protein